MFDCHSQAGASNTLTYEVYQNGAALTPPAKMALSTVSDATQVVCINRYLDCAAGDLITIKQTASASTGTSKQDETRIAFLAL